MTNFIEITNREHGRKEIVAIDSICAVSDDDGYACIYTKDDFVFRVKETVHDVGQKIKEIQQQNFANEIKQKPVGVKLGAEGYNLGYKRAVNIFNSEMSFVLKERGLSEEEINDIRRTIRENAEERVQ